MLDRFGGQFWLIPSVAIILPQMGQHAGKFMSKQVKHSLPSSLSAP
jgi:hypothetical protein